MRFCISRKPVEGPWGGGNLFVKGMSSVLKSKGHEVFYDLVPNLDYIIMIDPRPSNYGVDANQIFNYRYNNPATKIIHRINECDKRKGTSGLDDVLLTCANLSDKVVFISKWLQDYFIKKGFKGSSSVVYNGCDTNDFTFKEEIDLSEIHFVTHHWSDNILKGYDFYKELDNACEENKWKFTFIGRFNKDIQTKNIRMIDPCTGKDLADKIKLGNVYVTASKWEPCGMHHIEAAACGLPILYHEDGGGINEGCERYGESFSNMEDFKYKLELLIENYEAHRDEIKNIDLSITNCCESYYKVMMG